MPKVILSIGHHDNDPGAVANSTTEHTEVKKVVLAAADRLRNMGVDITVPPTILTLPQKIDWINARFSSSDFCFEIHLNSSTSSGSTGVSVWYCDGKEVEKSVAEHYSIALSTNLLLGNRGAKPDTQNRHGRLGIVRDTIPHAWLFEMGFITNSNDLSIFRQRGESAIVEAVIDLYMSGNPFLNPSDAWAFRDTPPAHYIFEAAKRAKQKGVIQPKEYFHPNDAITRAETIIILDRLGLLK